MAKTSFFCVATAGATVDGRVISPEMIQQMADTYKPATYTATINCEHLRGYSPDGPFNNWGSVVALKAQKVDVEIGNKTESRLGLFAQFDVTDAAMQYNKAGQKLFSSVEIQPNFAESGKAYLVGLAFTDSPASVATEVLKFSSRDDKRKENFIALSEVELAFEDEKSSGEVVTGAFAAMKGFFENFGKAPEPAPVDVPPPAPAVPADAAFAHFMAQFSQQMEALGAGIQAGFTAMDTKFTALAVEQATLAKTVENVPSRSYTARPAATGGDGGQRAEC